MPTPINLEISDLLKLIVAGGAAFGVVSGTFKATWNWFAARKVAEAKKESDKILAAEMKGAAELLASQHKESMERAAQMQEKEMTDLVDAVRGTDTKVDRLAAYFNLKWKNGLVNAWVPRTASRPRARVKP